MFLGRALLSMYKDKDMLEIELLLLPTTWKAGMRPGYAAAIL